MGRGGDPEVSRAFRSENCADGSGYGSRGGPSEASGGRLGFLGLKETFFLPRSKVALPRMCPGPEPVRVQLLTPQLCSGSLLPSCGAVSPYSGARRGVGECRPLAPF